VRIVLMGPPGSGKGTMAKLLVGDFGMAHLSSGDIFRTEQASGSDLGKKLGQYMQAGQLVPDATVVEVMAKAVASSNAPGGLLLDGFPRTVAQAEALDRQLEAAQKPLDVVVVLNVNDDVIVDRITGRRVNPRTGKIYHVRNMPPRVAGIDDETGEKLIQREDDREEVVRKRLDVYRRQTEPVIGYYRSRGKLPLIELDSSGPAEQVHRSLAEALRRLGGRA
jgi:adenylate kinase